jgi:sugar-specific transcriptional regulator TrmB
MNIEQKLTQYGLSAREAKIYLSSMDLGPSPAQKIAKHANIHRVAAYPVINTLIKKGLMSTFDKGKKTMYVASDPSHLEIFFDQQQQEITLLRNDFKKNLPFFEERYRSTPSSPRVRHYEGLEGVIAVNDEILDQLSATVMTIFDRNQTERHVPKEYIEKLRQGRKAKNITSISIYSYDGKSLPDTSDSVRYHIKDADLPIEADIAIFKDTVRFVSYQNDINTFVIDDPHIATTLRTLFSLATRYLEDKKS